jgi:hypothetical protein
VGFQKFSNNSEEGALLKYYKLNEIERLLIKPYVDSLNNANIMMESGARLKADKSCEMWEQLSKFIKEDFKGKHANLNHDKMTVTWTEEEEED